MDRITRRSFVAGLAIAPFAVRTLRAQPQNAKKVLLVGTEGKTSKGIYAFAWDADKGTLQQTGLAGETAAPGFLVLSPDGKRLFSVNSAGTPGGVSSFWFDAINGKLTLINRVPSQGINPCHIAVDSTGQAVFTANYTSGGISSFRVGYDGKLSEAVSSFDWLGHGPNADRQEKSHAHRVTVTPDNKYLLVNDLGLDCIHIFHLDAARAILTPNKIARWTGQPGSGPRSLRFHPKNPRIAYCVNELDSSVDVLEWDPKPGSLRSIQRVSLLPDGYKGQTRACESAIDSKGEFAFFANRDYDCLDSFKMDPAGKLTFISRAATGGKIARHIALDPTEKWLLVANQDTSNIAVIGRDPQTGALNDKPSHSYELDTPMCLVWA